LPRDKRAKILEELQAELGFPMLAYVTGDRPNLPTQIAPDQVILFPRHLKAIGNQTRAGLLLYTRGGDTNSAWPIINFLRAYFDEVVVLVPFFAHSAGTLICLGADRIYMSKLATLSPIDPSVANAFNPQDPTNPQTASPSRSRTSWPTSNSPTRRELRGTRTSRGHSRGLRSPCIRWLWATSTGASSRFASSRTS
jgi:membrane-bound ClpP family serine protease